MALLFLVYFFGILTVKQWEIMINNLLFSAINEETPYEQLLHYWFIVLSMLIEYQLQFYFDQLNVQTIFTLYDSDFTLVRFLRFAIFQ